MIVLDDFVMLGKTVPEPNSDGRVFVCSAGVSAQLQSLIRIYPLARRGAPKRWSVSSVSLERNPKDSRPESWKLAGDRHPGAHERINDVFAESGTASDRERARLLAPYRVGSIKEANDRRLSLAVLEPDFQELTFDHNPSSPDSPQMKLFDTAEASPQGAKRFPFMPRLRFHDEGGGHNLMLRDWGCYELMRKHDHSYFRQNMMNALSLTQSSSLLVGNMNHQRNAWLIISVLNNVREQPTLFDALPSDRPAIPFALRNKVLTRDGHRCRECGSTEQLVMDHIWPYIRGGRTTEDNLQTLCSRCNAIKGDRADGVA